MNASHLPLFDPRTFATFAAPIPVLHPQSHYARSIFDLSSWVLWVCFVIFLVVAGLVTYAGWKFRARTGSEDEPHQVFGSTKWEMIYVIPPTLLLAVIFLFTLRVMHTSDPEAQASGDDIVVVGHQWWWEIHYPKLGIVAANEIHIPAGQNVQFGFESADVIHDFWVPELGRKIDMIPGRHAKIWLAADHPGTYLGACAEFCGKEHAWMRIRVVADTPADFAAWSEEQLRSGGSTRRGPAGRGQFDVTNMSCANCHTIAGTSAKGKIGPDLTHVASRETLAAGRMQNTPDALSAWLLDPDAFKPGSHMPNLMLTNDQRSDIVQYLETLK